MLSEKKIIVKQQPTPNQQVNAALVNAAASLQQNKPTTESRNSSVIREAISSVNYTPRPANTASTSSPPVSFGPTPSKVVTVKPTALEYPSNNQIYRPAPQQQQQQQNLQPQQPKQLMRSELEQAVVNAKEPLRNVPNNEFVSIGPYRGIYLNKREADSYRGPISIEDFPVSKDPNPEIVRKKMEKVQMTQEIGVRYLNPPPAPKPGDLIIRERESNTQLVAPPLIIRQEGARAQTPPPRIYREIPPPQPPTIPEQTRGGNKILLVQAGFELRRKLGSAYVYAVRFLRLQQLTLKHRKPKTDNIIEVEGSSTATPVSRRVIIERMPDMPPKPAPIIVERWLPVRVPKRRVIHQRSASAHSFATLVPRNLIIEWEAPDVDVVHQCRDLGVVDASPDEYVRRFGNELVRSEELPGCHHARFSRTNPSNQSVRVNNNGNQQYRDNTIARSFDIEFGATPDSQKRYNDYMPAAVQNNNNSSSYPQYTSRTSRSPGRQRDYESSAFRSTAPGQSNKAEAANNVCQVHGSHRYTSSGQVRFVGYDLPDLEGDVEALTLIDLNRYGLQAYRDSITPSPASFLNTQFSLSRYNEERIADDRF